MNKKDTIYIDVDDEITAVIHKVISSKSKLVVLVLPKRASVFHSSVNLKLLKNKVLKANKNIVLVSTDASLLSLAGVVGLNVAKNLQDKPSIPKSNVETNEIDKAIDDLSEEDSQKTKSIGEVAASSAVGVGLSGIDDPDVIEFDNDAKKDEPKPEKEKKQKISKKLRVPDFGKFQKILIFSILGIIAIVVLYVIGFIYMPKARITIQSATSTLSNTIPFTLDSTQTTLDTANMVAPANLQTIQKTIVSSSVNTTGSKQVGIYATGSIAVNESPFSVDVPQGTIFTEDSSGLTYQTETDTTLNSCPPADYVSDKHGGFVCTATQNINVEATAYGTNYNIHSANDYTTDLSGLSGTYAGTAMSGATTPSTVQIVTQADINAATKLLAAPTTPPISQQLLEQIKTAGYTPLSTTFVAATPVITPSNNVGTQTNSVTVSGSYSYSMYGAYLSDLDTLVTNQIDHSATFNSKQQSILDTGSSAATFTVQSSTATAIKVSMLVSSVIGPKLNASEIKSESAGKSNADIINNISNIPGVKTVVIKYSPFWVTAMPHSVKKITIILEKADGSAA